MRKSVKLIVSAIVLSVLLGLSFSPLFIDPETGDNCCIWTWAYKEIKLHMMLQKAIA